MFWRSVAAPIQFGVIGFILLENVVDGSQQHPCDGNDGFFVPPALFESQVAVMDFREPLCPNGTKCALNKQRLDIGSSPADSVGFPRILVVIAEAALPNTSENTSSSLKLETVRQFCARFFSPVVKLVSFQR